MSEPMGDTMRAVVAEALGGPDVLAMRDDWPTPRPGAGQVAIAVQAAGVNFAETMSRRVGYLGAAPPFVPGLEVAGTVCAVGEGVGDVSIGDRVCALTLTGGYADVALARAAATFPLPSGVDFLVGAALPVIVPTAYAMLHPLGRIRRGDRVLVSSAAGGTGMILGQMGKHAGARQLTGIVSSPAKVAAAARYGFDLVLTADEAEAGGVGDASFDLVLDGVGGPARELARRATAPFGRLLLYGNSGGAPEAPLTAASLRHDNVMVGGWSLTTLARSDPRMLRSITADAFALIARGAVTLDVRHVFSPADAAQAHRLVESGESTGKVVLEIGAGSGSVRNTSR
jgi:NADPH2:quinone reductase